MPSDHKGCRDCRDHKGCLDLLELLDLLALLVRRVHPEPLARRDLPVRQD
jgi:hypothetical protein